MRTTIALLGLVTLTTPVAAQSLADACNAVQKVTVGQWAEYNMINREMGNDEIEIRMAFVGEEAKGGTAHYWFEMNMAGSQGNMIVQVLVPSWPYEQAQVAGMIMKAGDQPAMRMPDQMMSMMARRPGASSPARDVLMECNSAQLVGTETITVPAGTFETMHLRVSGNGQNDVWVSKDLPFALVKMQSDQATMELVDHGMDAKSSITETPRSMP